MNYRGNNNQCDICCGRTKCSYCGNVPREIPKREFSTIRWSKHHEFYELQIEDKPLQFDEINNEFNPQTSTVLKRIIDVESDEFKDILNLTTVRMSHDAHLFLGCTETFRGYFNLDDSDLLLTTGIIVTGFKYGESATQKIIVGIARGKNR